MKIKRFFAMLISTVMIISMISFLPFEGKASVNKTSILGGLEALANQSLNITPLTAYAATTGNLRRPVSSEQPMLIVHIDTWNYADPAKIIDLIPDDILPYVVFNISLSINWDSTNNKWLMVQDGYQTAKSWLKTCSDKGVWTMIQPSSGGQCHFPDYSANYDFENTLFAEFFRDYPSFIGYNYSEQFWGFQSEDFPVTPLQRYQHFAGLLKLCNKYGGYLNISWCANQWSSPLNPIAMLKKCTEWRDACSLYSKNYILEEKYTQGSFIEDVESEVLGAYLSGNCGNFGVRYDETGWTDRSADDKPLSSKNQYRVSTGLPIVLERMAFNGATIIDGPELIWADDFKEVGGVKDSEGYNMRSWAMHDQYQNDFLDAFRKVINGNIKIPTRQEVIDRTKVVVIQDNTTGDDHNKYSTYATLFEGLYRMPGDGNLKDNTNLYKSTGRYPTIPTVYALNDDLAKSFDVQLKQSQLSSRWATIAAKQNEFNKLFPSEYSGNCYAGRYENTWVTYNPNKTGTAAGGYLSLKYNTCKQMEVTYSEYASGLINEYSDHINIYLNNYDEDNKTTLKTNTFKFYGCTSNPTFTYKDRGVNQTKSIVSGSLSSDGTYTLTVQHNGPLDLTVNCSGAETNRLKNYSTATVTKPASASFYTGTRQYEGEFFDTKNVESNVANGCSSGITGYWGQGFMKFGTKSTAAVKDTVTTTKAGSFDWTLRYAVTSDINCVDLYVNGTKVKTLSLSKGSSLSDWKTIKQSIALNKGDNKVELKATSTLASTLYLDNFVVSGDFGDATVTTPTTPTTPTMGSTVTLNDGWYCIKNVNAQKYLQVANNIGQAAQNVELGTGSGATSQKWYLTNVGNGYVTLKSALGDFMVDVANGEDKDGANIQIYNAYSNTAQKFSIKASSTTGAYAIATMASNQTKVLDDYNFETADGTKVCQWTYGGKDNQLWTFEPTKYSNKIIGDVNDDGKVNSLDYALLKSYLLGNPTNINTENADLNSDGKINAIDFATLKSFILGKTTGSTEAVNVKIDPTAYMKTVSASIVDREPSNATVEQSNVTYGKYEKKTFYSNVCKRNKDINVLLPAGYSPSKKYPVLYVLHGYWGNEDALLDSGDASLRLRQIIGNAIAAGQAKEMIVVFPDIYASATQDACSGLDATNNAAYDNFINLLVKEIMPYMEKNYSIKTGKDNTAITGFSMGGRESLYIGFSRPDLFSYVGAMCPAPGLTTDQIPDSKLKFTDTNTSPYLLMISAGSNDTLIYSTPAGYHTTLNKNGVTHVWHYVTGGDHGGKTIRPHMYNFVRAIFKA